MAAASVPQSRFIAYRITHLASGKTYIGITSVGIKMRMQRHVSKARKLKKPLYDAFNCYGLKAFEVVHIASASNWDDLYDLEKLLIRQENTHCPFGYNLTDGGKGLWNPSAEIRQKIRDAKSTPEAREIMRQVHLGKPKSAQHRARIGAARLGVKRTAEQCAKFSSAQKNSIKSKANIERLRGVPRSPDIIKKMHAGRDRFNAQRTKELEEDRLLFQILTREL